MQNGTENFVFPASSSQQLVSKKSTTTTYLAKIAVLLQDAPGKMLTFSQLMEKLAPIGKDRKSVENNIRVCLSTHKCFVKIPVVLDSMDSRRNYWKLEPGHITAKMVRRHFKGLLHLFPELASKVEPDNKKGRPSSDQLLHSPEAVGSREVQVRCSVKFSSPFSIESLLKRDSAPSARASTASPLSSVQRPRSTHTPVGTKRSFSWDSEEHLLQGASQGAFPIRSTHHGLNRMHVCTEPSFPVHTRDRAAPYYTSPHNSHITYSVPAAFTHDALRFWL